MKPQLPVPQGNPGQTAVGGIWHVIIALQISIQETEQGPQRIAHIGPLYALDSSLGTIGACISPGLHTSSLAVQDQLPRALTKVLGTTYL